MLEIEVKLPIDNADSIRDIITGLGFEEAGEFRERDLYFDSVQGQIKNSGQALRVRENTNLKSGRTYAEVNFKDRKLDDVTMSRREVETEVVDGEAMVDILKSLGFMPVEPYVVKTRQLFCRYDMNACIDIVEGLGVFLELEIVAEVPEGADEQDVRIEGLSRIEDVLKQIGYSVEETINRSYLGLLMGKK